MTEVRKCERDGCENTFTPRMLPRPQRFCCRQCRIAFNKTDEIQIEISRQRQADYRKRHPEVRIAYRQRIKLPENIEKFREMNRLLSRRYRSKNTERVREYAKENYAKNRDRILDQSRSTRNRYPGRYNKNKQRNLKIRSLINVVANLSNEEPQ